MIQFWPVSSWVHKIKKIVWKKHLKRAGTLAKITKSRKTTDPTDVNVGSQCLSQTSELPMAKWLNQVLPPVLKKLSVLSEELSQIASHAPVVLFLPLTYNLKSSQAQRSWFNTPGRCSTPVQGEHSTVGQTKFLLGRHGDMFEPQNGLEFFVQILTNRNPSFELWSQPDLHTLLQRDPSKEQLLGELISNCG